MQSLYIITRHTSRRLRSARVWVVATCMALSVLAGGTLPDQPSGQFTVHASADVPAVFVPNHGQADPSVRFELRRPHSTLYFKPDAILLGLDGSSKCLDDYAAGDDTLDARRPCRDSYDLAIGLHFVGATSTIPEAEDPLPGRINYIVGRTAAQWHTDLPTFGAIRYHQLYPGVDLVYDASAGLLKGTFEVAAQVDVDRIRWRYDSVANIELRASDGALLIRSPRPQVIDGVRPSGGDAAEADLVEKPPTAWQVDGLGNRRPVDIAYRLRSGEISLAVGAYDRGRELHIDPVFDYGTYLGAKNEDEADAIAVDDQGNAYVAGSTNSIRFPGTFTAAVPGVPEKRASDLSGVTDAFIAKLSPDGKTLVCGAYIGGERQEHAYSIAVDHEGFAHITGSTTSDQFPIQVVQGNGAKTLLDGYQGRSSNTEDAFVTKLGPDCRLDGEGALKAYSAYLGYTGKDIGYAIAIDPEGNAYVAGVTDSPFFTLIKELQEDAPGVPNDRTIIQANKAGQTDAFVVKINPAGSRPLVEGTLLGGTGVDEARGLAVGKSGEVFLAVSTSSPGFPFPKVCNGAATGPSRELDAVVVKIDDWRDRPAYCTQLGGGQADEARALALDPAGDVYVTGLTKSDGFPVVPPDSAFQRSFAGAKDQTDAFAARLDGGSGRIIYSTYLGGSGIDGGWAIAADDAGRAYVAGFTKSSGGASPVPGQFPLVQPFLSPKAGDLNGFLTVFAPDGQSLVFSDLLGGRAEDEARGLALGAAGSVYVTGRTRSLEMPVSSPPLVPYQATLASNNDAFILKLEALVPTATPTITPIPSSTPTFNPVETSVAATLTALRPTPTLTPIPTRIPSSTPSPTPTPRNLYLPIAISEMCPPQYIFVDVVLIMDASTSMEQPTSSGRRRLDAAVEAARLFIDGMRVEPGKDQVAVVALNSGSTIVQSLTTDRKALDDALSSITTRLGSRIDLGIARANEVLSGFRHRPGNLRAMVLLSDGQITEALPAAAIVEANRAKSGGVTIHVIGVNPSNGRPLLRTIAADDDRYIEAEDHEALVKIYKKLPRQVSCPKEILWGDREWRE